MPARQSRLRVLACRRMCEPPKLGGNFDLSVLVVRIAKPRREQCSAALYKLKLLWLGWRCDILDRANDPDDANQFPAITQNRRGKNVDADQRLARRLVVEALADARQVTAHLRRVGQRMGRQ